MRILFSPLYFAAVLITLLPPPWGPSKPLGRKASALAEDFVGWDQAPSVLSLKVSLGGPIPSLRRDACERSDIERALVWKQPQRKFCSWKRKTTCLECMQGKVYIKY